MRKADRRPIIGRKPMPRPQPMPRPTPKELGNIPALQGDYGEILGPNGMCGKWIVVPPRVSNKAAYSYAHKWAKRRNGRVRMA